MATILVVDDEPDIVMLTRLNLERDGHVVREAGCADEALAAMAAELPDLVVLDVMMPEVDGFSLLAQLKGDDALAGIPVIMLTALGGPMDKVRGGIEGAVRYLTKPLDLEELRTAVTEALAQPEGPQRRAAQRQALETLARIERDAPVDAPGSLVPRPRLSAFEHARVAPRPQPAGPRVDPALVEALTDKQHALLVGVAGAPTVMEAAERMSMSRSNIYASLRRIGRRLGVDDVTDLLDLLRRGELKL